MKDLNQVLSGKFLVKMRDDVLIINQPDATVRYLADFFADEVYEDAFKEGVYVHEELEHIIIQNGWWTQDKEDELTQIPKDLEQMKVDYFNNFIRDDTKSLIKKGIRKKESRFEELTQEKYQFFNYTCESLRSQAYTTEVLKRCTFYENGDRISLDNISIHALYQKYNAAQLSDDDIREISKSPQWRMIWNAAKDGHQLFPLPACDLTASQKTLISWTRMYDSIYESMETPAEAVIEDDIAIDGWFIVQRRQREDDRKENEKNKLPETEEVFVMVNSQKEADHVYNMNTEQGKRLHNTKLREAKEKGSMNESEFSQTKQQNQMAANRATFERFKR